jgi:uracil-DNA glycosylase family 4
VSLRQSNRIKHPDWFNAPVPAFGPLDAPFLIVGLAPGLRGANRTGRPFTGDYAGVLLYETILRFGFASGSYGEHPDDGLVLKGCRIINAVRCVPPENKPLPEEIATCNGFLKASISGMRDVKAILALGKIAFGAVLRASNLKPSRYTFAHGAAFDLGDGRKLFGSYHCSRYNTNTGRLTPAMFHRVFEEIAAHLRPAGNAGHHARVD